MKATRHTHKMSTGHFVRFFMFSSYPGKPTGIKRLFALALILSCVCTMFAGASFKDSADIREVNTEAVELLDALGIIRGYTDGSYLPAKTVTRAEMAKMIYTICNGGSDDAAEHVSIATSFEDIGGHWAEGYIKFLQDTDIVAGRNASRTIFNPDGTVTVGEAMKMALVLAGYRSDKAELTGSDWLQNTISLATAVGMTDYVPTNTARSCTRQDAAQILYNTLTNVWAVRWSEVAGGFVNDSKRGYALGGNPITVGSKWIDLTVYIGRLTASDGQDNGKNCYVVELDTVNGLDAGGRTDVAVFPDKADYADLIGQQVRVLVHEKTGKVYGIYTIENAKKRMGN